MPTRRQTHAAFLALMGHFEARLRRQAVIDKNRFILTCAVRYQDDGTPNFFDLTDRHQKDIQTTLATAYSKIIPAFGRHALDQVPKRGKSFNPVRSRKDDDDDLWLDLADEWIHREGLKRAHSIADTSESDVLAAISKGVEEGLGTAEIARNIRKVTGISGFRAELIARTETHAAANYAGIETVRDAEKTLGITMVKQWLPTLDGRTREDHAAMAGTPPIAMDEKFEVGGSQMDRPGDPSAPADQVIGCRCTLVYEEGE